MSKQKTKNIDNNEIVELTKKEKDDLYNAILNDNGNESHVDFFELSDEKFFNKQFKKMVKSQELYKVLDDSTPAIYVAFIDKLDDDGTYHIGYWIANNPDNAPKSLGKFLDFVINQNGIENIVLSINQNDVATQGVFDNRNKVMLFEGVAYYNGSLDPNSDEWFPLDNVSKDTFLTLKDDSAASSNFSEKQEEQVIATDDQAQEAVQETQGDEQQAQPESTENVVNPEEQAVAQEEQVAAMDDQAQEPVQDVQGVEQQAQYEEYQEPVVEGNVQEEDVQQEAYSQPSANDMQQNVNNNQCAPKTNWADKFYSLEGCEEYGILSPRERFSNQKQANSYTSISDSFGKKYSTNSLSSLKEKASSVGQANFSKYEETRKRVLDNLNKLRGSSNINKESHSSIYRSSSNNRTNTNVSTTSDILKRIEEIKKRMNQ